MPSSSSVLVLAPFTDLGGVGGPLERYAPDPVAPLVVRRMPLTVAPAMALLCPVAPTAPLVADTPDLLRAGADPPNLHMPGYLSAASHEEIS